MVVVVKSKSAGSGCGSSNTTASRLYMKYNASSLHNLEEWRDKLFAKTRGGSGVGNKTPKAKQDGKDERGEKGEKGEKEIENQILNIEEGSMKKDYKSLYISLDVNKVVTNLSVHLEKIQSAERKEKIIDKKRGDIVYKTKDGRVLHAFHSCEQRKIIWDDNVYDDLKTWLAAASVVAPCRID